MPENLDAFQQVLASMLVVVIGGSIAFFGFTKKWLEKFSPKPPMKEGDAVVISAAFADREAITKLTKAIDRLSENTIDQNIMLRVVAAHSEQEVAIQRSHTSAIDSMCHQIRNLVDAIHTRMK